MDLPRAPRPRANNTLQRTRTVEEQIKEFLNNVEGRFWLRKNELSTVFEWGYRMVGQKRSMVQDKQKLDSQLAQQKATDRKLSQELHDTAIRFQQVSDECDHMKQYYTPKIDLLNAQYDNMVSQQTESRNREVKDLKEQYDIYISQLKANQDREVSRLQENHSQLMADHDREVSRLESLHIQETSRLESSHTQETSRLENEIKTLVGQLLVNQTDSQAWPDDKLRIKYRHLQQLIESVASSNAIPQNQLLSTHLDPTNFLTRVGGSNSNFLLRSAIWAILQEQSFSAPFGFGALGPGEAQKELMNVYFAWRKIFDRPARTGTADCSS
jgi:hypothetical protein